jgi:hypothetical protein
MMSVEKGGGRGRIPLDVVWHDEDGGRVNGTENKRTWLLADCIVYEQANHK